jgi:hypothetical protein
LKEIRLTQGKVAMVDDADFEKLSRHKWFAQKNSRTWYAQRTVTIRPKVQTAVLMHREILGLRHGDHIECDHEDGNGLNNQRYNLRPCFETQNKQNRMARSGKKYSHFKGVDQDPRHPTRPWRAQITVHGIQKRLPRFKTEEAAALAYNEMAKRHFGEFARLNVLERIVQ